MLKQHGLDTEIDNTSTRTDFLDIVLDLDKQTYEPYNKHNHKFKYIDIRINHPVIIKKNLPRVIEKRISTLSTDKSIFNKHKTMSEKALNEAGFKNEKLKYQKRDRHAEVNRNK